MQLSMKGRNALITGGSLGIGRAIAKHFTGAGANVALVARRQNILDEARAEVAAASNAKVVTVAADVGTAEGCRAAFAAAEAGLGHIDVLVNNAGTSQRGPFESISDELWQHDIDLKLLAAIRLSRAAFAGMTWMQPRRTKSLGVRPSIRSPANSIEPLVTSPRSLRIKFEIAFKVVDLPAPLAPSRATILPGRTVSETPFSTRIT